MTRRCALRRVRDSGGGGYETGSDRSERLDALDALIGSVTVVVVHAFTRGCKACLT